LLITWSLWLTYVHHCNCSHIHYTGKQSYSLYTERDSTHVRMLNALLWRKSVITVMIHQGFVTISLNSELLIKFQNTVLYYVLHITFIPASKLAVVNNTVRVKFHFVVRCYMYHFNENVYWIQFVKCLTIKTEQVLQRKLTLLSTFTVVNSTGPIENIKCLITLPTRLLFGLYLDVRYQL
jgi:hypothetical protein